MDTSLQEPTLPSSNGESLNATATLSLNSSQLLCYALCTLTIGVALITIPPPPFSQVPLSHLSPEERESTDRQPVALQSRPSVQLKEMRRWTMRRWRKTVQTVLPAIILL